jgi:hypothetical protein
MRTAAGFCVLALVAMGCSSGTTGVGSADGGAGNGTGTGETGGEQGTGTGTGRTTPTIEQIAEKEPNNGPDRSGMQDIGAFSDAKTVVIKGHLESGGFDGQSYTGDFDAFAFSVAAAGGQMSATIDWTGAADVDVGVYDANLSPVAGDVGAAKPIMLPKNAAPAGNFAVVLYSKDVPTDWTMTITYTKPIAGSGGSCVSPLEAVPSGGCSFTMNEPASNGASIALPYVFGWRSDGCETPGKVIFFGNPPTPENSVSFSYTRGGQMSLLNVTGQHTLTQADLAGITSDNGVYHWQLESFHGGRSEARTFTIGGTSCK